MSKETFDIKDLKPDEEYTAEYEEVGEGWLHVWVTDADGNVVSINKRQQQRIQELEND